jgi:hypothetical protein
MPLRMTNTSAQASQARENVFEFKSPELVMEFCSEQMEEVANIPLFEVDRITVHRKMWEETHPPATIVFSINFIFCYDQNKFRSSEHLSEKFRRYELDSKAML